jgi:hypothetical protein
MTTPPRLFSQVTHYVHLRGTHDGGKGCIVCFRKSVSEHRKSADMGEFLVAMAAKVAEAIIMRLVWELWAACSRSLRMNVVAAAA